MGHGLVRVHNDSMNAYAYMLFTKRYVHIYYSRFARRTICLLLYNYNVSRPVVHHLVTRLVNRILVGI